MGFYVRANETGLVVATMTTVADPGDGWVEIGSPPANTLDQAYVLEGNQLVGTGQPQFPPSFWYSWDAQSRQWVDRRTQEERTAQQWADVRTQRNRLLLESDWTDTYSAPTRLGQTLYAAWQTYRQALRDVTQQPDPFNITWPQPPN